MGSPDPAHYVAEWPSCVVIQTTNFNLLPSIMPIAEGMLFQALLPEATVKAFDVHVVHRFATSDEL